MVEMFTSVLFAFGLTILAFIALILMICEFVILIEE